MKRAFLFLVLLISTSVFGQDFQKISNDFFLRIAPKSNDPVRPRGDGRHRHWESGFDTRIKHGRTEFQGGVAFVGAATFDNPDSLRFRLALRERITKRFFFEAVHVDEYALNELPVPDPAARRPNSSVNSWEFGSRFDLRNKNKKRRLTLIARAVPSGDEPVWYGYFTKPYVRADFGFDAERDLPHGIRLSTLADTRMGNGGGRVDVTAFVEKSLHKNIFGEIRGMYRANYGMPANLLNSHHLPIGNHGYVSFGIVYRVGH